VTGIAFHFNAPDKLGYACRLLRKAWAQRARVVVTGDDAQLRDLDRQLWNFSALDFLPHCLADAPAAQLARTPIVLAPAPAHSPHQQVLVNLGDTVPEGFEHFERLIEVVSQEPRDRDGARARWRHYAGRGYAIERRDLELRE